MTRMLPQHMSVEDRESLERDYWRDSPTERPGVDSLLNLLNKFADARRFNRSLERHCKVFEGRRDIVELGGGQGWASCIVKRVHPSAQVTLTDLSEDAIASLPVWERVFATRIDRRMACRSAEIPLEDESIDLAFCFAAAHHFPNHRATFRELRRVLRSGGACVYFYEPTCPAWLHPIAVRRVNAIRRDIPEDVIVPQRICATAAEEGFAATATPDVEPLDRAGSKALYYATLRALPFLQHVMPVTRDFVFMKR